jgi:hypothetical protein
MCPACAGRSRARRATARAARWRPRGTVMSCAWIPSAWTAGRPAARARAGDPPAGRGARASGGGACGARGAGGPSGCTVARAEAGRARGAEDRHFGGLGIGDALGDRNCVLPLLVAGGELLQRGGGIVEAVSPLDRNADCAVAEQGADPLQVLGRRGCEHVRSTGSFVGCSDGRRRASAGPGFSVAAWRLKSSGLWETRMVQLPRARTPKRAVALAPIPRLLAPSSSCRARDRS